MEIEGIPPQNIEAEKAVIGAIILDPDSLLISTDVLEAQDFYMTCHQEIYNACLDLYQLGESIELVNLVERLRGKGKLEAVGGASYISHIVSEVPTTALVRTHAKIVREKAILRRILRWVKQIETDISDVTDIQQFLTELEKRIVEFSDGVREKKSSDVTDILCVVEKRWDDEKQGLGKYIPVDEKLEEIVPRFCPGHLWVIGGYTSVGKSTFLAQLIVDVCGEKASCLVFSLEDSREEKLIKLIANLSGVSQRRLMTGDFQDWDEKVKMAQDTAKRWRLKIYDDVYSVDEIRLKIKKHKLRTGLDVVCIDYIQNIQGSGTLYEKLSDAIVKLQKIAKDLQVTMIVVSQVSNEAMRAHSEIIGLKGAGELAAAADIVLWLKRVKGEGKEYFLDCEIRKNRPFGRTGSRALMFYDNWTKIGRRH